MSKSDDYVCPVFANSGKCDQDALEVMEQFKDFYESKLNEVDVQGGGDCLELKLKIQRRWIDDLTEQTQMMARIVKELEDEATSRVRMLEDKLRQTSKSAYEVMKRYQTYSISHDLDEPFQKVFYLESDLKNVLEFVRRIREDRKWSIDGLRFYDVAYRDLFGKDRSCECDDAARETSLSPVSNGINFPKKETSNHNDNEGSGDDFTQQLKRKTEEYEALKRSMLDMRSALTEEVACKHDMISALKRDVQQLEERCIQADKQTAFKDDIIKELRKEIKLTKQQNKDKEAELAKQLEDAHKTIRDLQRGDMKSTHTMTDVRPGSGGAREETKLEREIQARQTEVEELKQRCKELENTLANSQGRADNLQKAVDLYINSINLLEASEEKAKIEIEQQKIIIANLQEALVSVKHELDELRQHNQDVEHYRYLSNVFYTNLTDVEEKNTILESDNCNLASQLKRVKDHDLELEVELFNKLQDLAILDTQLAKYQTEFKQNEEDYRNARTEIKKLRHQNRGYEHVVQCFKHEMAVMSEQLVNLQEILNLSNQSCKEENEQLQRAVLDLQHLGERLQAELMGAEKKVLLENQKSQLKDAKIGELQEIIGQKNADLTVHDEAINNMKQKFERAVLENHELRGTIASLNSTVLQLQCAAQCSEVAKSHRRCSRKSVSDFEYEKGRRLEKLQEEYREQYETVKAMQHELDRVKEKSKEKLKTLKQQNDELKERLATSELSNQRLFEQLSQLKDQSENLMSREKGRDEELVQGKEVIREVRKTLSELNNSLFKYNLPQVSAIDQKLREKRKSNDIYANCRCELELFKKIAENLTNSLLETTCKCKELETRHRQVTEELNSKIVRIAEIEEQSARKQKDACKCIEDLTDKLNESQLEERRMSDFINTLKDEVQRSIESKKEARHVIINCCDCDQDAAATQEEITELKVEIKNMIQNQLDLNNENDKLLKQVNCLQATICGLEEKIRHLRQKVEKLQNDNQCMKEKNKGLVRDREALDQTVRKLELELVDAKNQRDDLCVESTHIIGNVKAWLEEQKKINEKVKKKTKCYCDTITKLKQENRNILNSRPPIRIKQGRSPSPISDYPNTWGFDSQGGSIAPSPCDSPASCTCSIEEWYSPNFKDDDETTDRDDDFIITLETVAKEMKNNNKKWKNKDHMVSKDGK